MVGAYWGVGSWWALVFVVCWGAWSSCGVGALGCLVNLGGVCVAVLLRSGAVLALWCGLGSGAVLVEVCGVLHVFGGVVVGGWWCSVEPVPGQSGRAMNLGRAL